MKSPINSIYSDPAKLNKLYLQNNPFPHIVLDEFIDSELLGEIHAEFPNLSKIKTKKEFSTSIEKKTISTGFEDLSPKAFQLISYLNSDLFLKFLQDLTGIKEILISDPYLAGGGYHEIKNGGLLKVHADFNKHPFFNLDRRINLLLYLNRDWKEEWGGSLEFYSENDLNSPRVSVVPEFNRCVIFSTTSYTFHGNPTPVKCPADMSRKSLALYYFSIGRPKSEMNTSHGTMFVETRGEKHKKQFDVKSLIIELTPPILFKYLKKIYRKRARKN